MRGTGTFAGLLAQRFKVSCRKLGLEQGESAVLRTDLFTPPEQSSQQAGQAPAAQFEMF